MEFKILEANGVENENVDGAAFNNVMAGGENGIFKGILNECNVYSPTSNSIAIGTGVVMVQGFRIKITDPYIHNFSSVPVEPTEYHLVAKITLLSTRDVSFELICRRKQELVQENLFRTESGVYEAEIATFVHAVSGEITNLEMKMEFLYSAQSSIELYNGSVEIE